MCGIEKLGGKLYVYVLVVSSYNITWFSIVREEINNMYLP